MGDKSIYGIEITYLKAGRGYIEAYDPLSKYITVYLFADSRSHVYVYDIFIEKVKFAEIADRELLKEYVASTHADMKVCNTKLKRDHKAKYDLEYRYYGDYYPSRFGVSNAISQIIYAMKTGNDFNRVKALQEVRKILIEVIPNNACICVIPPSNKDGCNYILDIIKETDRCSMEEKIDGVLRVKDSIRKHVSEIASCTAIKDLDETLFVVEQASDDYDEGYKKHLEVHIIKDDEALEKVSNDFGIWESDKDVRIQHYGLLGIIRCEEIAGYNIAKKSVEDYGVSACCVEILHELLCFGYTEERRKENIEAFTNELKESEDDIEEARCVDCEDFIEKMRQSILDDCKSEDERQHMIFRREYKEKVSGIEYRHRMKIYEQNEQVLVDFIRSEYLGRC